MTEGEFVPYLPPPEKIVELLEKLDQGVALGVIWFHCFPSGHVKRAFGAQNCRRRERWCPLSEKMLIYSLAFAEDSASVKK